MSNPYGHRGRYHETPTHHSRVDGASSAQASDYDQDSSARQGPYDYSYSTQQTTQQSIENPVSCSTEQHPHQDEDPGKYSDEQYSSSEEDSYGYSRKDPYSDSEDMEEGSDDYPVNDTTLPDAFQRPSENSRLHPHQVPDAYQAQGSYPAAGPTSGNEAFKSPGFTSWGDRPGPSQPYATSQMEGSWDSARRFPALPDTMQNPYKFVEQPVIGFERPASATDSIFGPEQEREARTGVAHGWSLEEPDSPQHPAVWQPGAYIPPRASHEVVFGTEPDLDPGPWTAEEVEKLETFKEKYGTRWEGVGKVIHGRTKMSIQKKWSHMHSLRPQKPPKLPSADLSLLKNEIAGLIAISHSQRQRDSLPRPFMSTYRSLTHTAPGQLNGEDDGKLREAVATGASFQDIKDFIFGDRFDLSPEILADRAREIHANWSPREDLALLHSLNLPIETDDDSYVGSVQADLQARGSISELRSTADTRARIKHLMDIGEVYNLRKTPAEESSEVDVDGGQPCYISDHPNTDPDYATPSPRLVYHRMTQEEFEDIKLWVARGYTWTMIVAKCCPHRTKGGIAAAMHRQEYERWTDEQDDHLLELQAGNNGNWAEIRRQLSGPERSEGEILERVWLLTEGRSHKRKRTHKYLDDSSIDDDYVRLRLAQGRTYAEIAKERFRGMGPPSLERFATTIGATWSKEDDKKLRDKVLEYEYYGLEVDWESIGQEYDPLRPADILEIRWMYLRGML